MISESQNWILLAPISVLSNHLILYGLHLLTCKIQKLTQSKTRWCQMSLPVLAIVWSNRRTDKEKLLKKKLLTASCMSRGRKADREESGGRKHWLCPTPTHKFQLWRAHIPQHLKEHFGWVTWNFWETFDGHLSKLSDATHSWGSNTAHRGS